MYIGIIFNVFYYSKIIHIYIIIYCIIAVRKAERRAQKKNTMQDQATQATVTTKEQYVQAENKIAVPNIARGSLLPPLVLPEPCKKITQKPAVEVTTSEVAIAKTKKVWFSYLFSVISDLCK